MAIFNSPLGMGVNETPLVESPFVINSVINETFAPSPAEYLVTESGTFILTESDFYITTE